MAGPSLEATASVTLGSNDTVSGDSNTMGESIGPSVVNTSKEKSKTPWVDLFKPKCDRKDMLRLEFFAPVNGGAVIEDNELIVFKEPWPFALLGCFAGRFPGITAIQSLVDSWKVPCKWYTQPNDHVLFKFNTEEDRCKIAKGEFYLYGKQLFLKSLPEHFHLENKDFSTLPIWVQFPSLPVEFWGATALSKIASCIGKPLWADDITKVSKKGGYARVLVEIDTSSHPLVSIPVSTPSGYSFVQEVYYEMEPCFCTKCCSNDHYKEECTGKWKSSRKGKRGKSNGKRGRSRKPRSKGRNPSPAAQVDNLNNQPVVLEEQLGKSCSVPPVDTASEPLGLQKVSEEPRSSEPSQEHPPTSEEACLETEQLVDTMPVADLETIDMDKEQESPKDPVQSEPASPISSGTNGNSVASPLGSNTARGKNVLNNVIAEVFHDNAGAKAKKKTNPKNNVAPKNLSGTLGYKEALMSPPSDKEITNIVDKRLAKKLTPLPVKDKTAARGGGRRKPTSVLK
nr:uncharacterized protein LOC111395991 [Ipomoea batatas]